MQEDGGLHRAVVVAVNLVKANLPVKVNGRVEEGERVQQHMPIADLAGVIKNASDQLFTDLVAPEVRPDVQPLQLAALLVQLPQADAAARRPSQ